MGKNGETVRFSVSIPAGLLRELDERVIHKGYHSRSELVRDLIRERIVASRWKRGKEEVVGVLTISYDHHQKQLVQRLLDIQHGHRVNVLCTTHVHVEHDCCLEAIIIKGKPRALERLSLEIGGLRGVRIAKLTRASRLGI